MSFQWSVLEKWDLTNKMVQKKFNLFGFWLTVLEQIRLERQTSKGPIKIGPFLLVFPISPPYFFSPNLVIKQGQFLFHYTHCMT